MPEDDEEHDMDALIMVSRHHGLRGDFYDYLDDYVIYAEPDTMVPESTALVT